MLAFRALMYGLCRVNHGSNQESHPFPCNKLVYYHYLAVIHTTRYIKNGCVCNVICGCVHQRTSSFALPVSSVAAMLSSDHRCSDSVPNTAFNGRCFPTIITICSAAPCLVKHRKSRQYCYTTEVRKTGELPERI